MRVLGIETTCDETAAAVVRLRPDGSGEILADEVMSQIAAHAPYGGVVPEIAARAHVEILDSLIARALSNAGAAAKDLDGVAAAAGPGLIGGVLVGLMAGKGFALATGKPFVAVNHLEAHALTARLAGNARVSLSASSWLLAATRRFSRSRASATTIGSARPWTTRSARPLIRPPSCSGLPYPGGPAVEAAAMRATRSASLCPGRCMGEPNADFSLSGLKTAVRLAAEACGSPQAPRRRRSLRLVPGGDRRRGRGPHAHGAQALPRAPRNRRQRRRHRRRRRGERRDSASALTRFCAEAGLPMIAPPQKLCTDNGAMIAWAGIERLSLGLQTIRSTRRRARAGRSIRSQSERATTSRKTGRPAIGCSGERRPPNQPTDARFRPSSCSSHAPCDGRPCNRRLHP